MSHEAVCCHCSVNLFSFSAHRSSLNCVRLMFYYATNVHTFTDLQFIFHDFFQATHLNPNLDTHRLIILCLGLRAADNICIIFWGKGIKITSFSFSNRKFFVRDKWSSTRLSLWCLMCARVNGLSMEAETLLYANAFAGGLWCHQSDLWSGFGKIALVGHPSIQMAEL